MDESSDPERENRARHQLQESFNLWDDTKTVLFREVVDSERVTLDSSFEVVDIRPSAGGQNEVLMLSWDKVKVQKYHYSCCQLKSEEHDFKNFMKDISENNYNKLCTLCLQFFSSYAAKIMRVSTNPIAFTFAHQNAEMGQAMQKDESNLVELFSNLLSLEDVQHLKLQWKQQRRKHPEQKTSAELKVQEDTNDVRRRTRGVSELQFVQSNEQWTLEREYTTSELFPSLLSSNESILQPQQPTSVRRKKTLDSRCENVSITQPNSMSVDSLLHMQESDSITRRSINNIRREHFERTQPLDNSDSMVTTSDTCESRPETFSEIQPNSNCDVMSSMSRTSTNTYQTYSDSHVSTAEESSAQTRSREMEGVCRSTWDACHTKPKTVHSVLPVTSNQTTAKAFSEDRRCMPIESTRCSTAEAEQFLSAVGVSGISDDIKRLTETVGFALLDNLEMPPKASCLDTILCLDASSSMGEEGFEEMKNIACHFIDGVEHIAEQYEIEENISVVAFGGRSRIEHFLSNDYGSIRDAIDNLQFGGRSPLFEALLISLCAVHGRGGSLNISGVHIIQPRLIIMTDGKPSDAKEHTTMDVESVDQNVTVRLINLMQNFNDKKSSSIYPRPVTWIPVGNANMEWINSMATLGGGEVRPSTDVMKLCKYQRIQETIGKTFAFIQNGMCHDTGDLTDDIKVLVDAFSGDLDSGDKAEVLDTVKAKLEGKHGYDCEDDNPRGWDNIQVLEDSNLPPLGARVIRGPHWHWGNQDTDGPGTVINHIPDEKGWIWVIWDNGDHNIYRSGDEDCYDLVVVTDQPKYICSDMMIDIGCEVTRGPDWEERYQDQDGGPGGIGIVIRSNKQGEVKVRWNLTHEICSYRYGQSDKLDLTIRDPVDILKEITAESPVTSDSSKSSPLSQGNMETPEECSDDSRWVWQWKDETERWHLYPEEDIHKMETAYNRRPEGSCLIRRCGVSCRVMFTTAIERGIDTESTIYVRRQRMTEDDIVVIKAADI